MPATANPTPATELAALERRVAALEERLDSAKNPSQEGKSTSDSRTGDLWIIDGLVERAIDGVTLAGSVQLDEGPVQWQYGLTTDALTAQNWTELSDCIGALSHPARLRIMQLVLQGVGATSALAEQDDLGTTGQIHHHLRQLVAAGWLAQQRRGVHHIPPHRLVPLLVIVLAAIR